MIREYMIREEWQRGKLREREGRRAWKFERRLEESRRSEIVRRCWKEMRISSRRGEELSKWEMEKKD